MINFTVGPVQMSKKTLLQGKRQIPYFRTEEFSLVTKENERLLLKLAEAPTDSRVVFMTGSGTASMEASVINFLGEKDKVLVVNGGSFGERLVQLCQIHNINHTQIKLDYGKPLKKDVLYKYANSGYTATLLQLCETSTGVLYDIDMVGEFCKENNMFLIVDAISGFLADSVSMQKNNINVLITGSQKALALPPCMSFIMLDAVAQKRCQEKRQKTLYFDLKLYLLNGKRGQTPFTPAVATMLMLNQKLKDIEKTGGYFAYQKNIQKRAEYFRCKIKDLPLLMFTNIENSSNCVTSLVMDDTKTKISAYKLFEILKNKYKIWICPNGGELKEKVFRVGHIGQISKKQIDKLLKALKKVLLQGGM